MSTNGPQTGQTGHIDRGELTWFATPQQHGAAYDTPARLIREEDWQLIEAFIRDCANLGEHNAYSDGAAAILLPVAVGNIAERARRLMGEVLTAEDIQKIVDANEKLVKELKDETNTISK